MSSKMGEFMKSKAVFVAISCLCGSALVLSPVAAAPQRGAAQQQGVREVTVTEIPGVIAAGAELEIVLQGTDNANRIVCLGHGGVVFAPGQAHPVIQLDQNDKASLVP